MLLELDTLDNKNALALLQNSQWQKSLQPERNSVLLLKMHRNEIPGFHIWLVHQNIQIISLQSRHSLEDYFLQVTSGEQHVAAFAN